MPSLTAEPELESKEETRNTVLDFNDFPDLFYGYELELNQDNSVDVVISIDLSSPIDGELVFLPQFRDQYSPEFGSNENDWLKILNIAAPNSGYGWSGSITNEEEYTNNLFWNSDNEFLKPSWTDLENIFYDQYIYGFGGEISLQKPELNFLPLSERKINCGVLRILASNCLGNLEKSHLCRLS